MKFRKKIIAVLFLFLLLLLYLCFKPHVVVAETDQERLDDLNKKIEEYTQKINELQGEQKTLSSTIGYLDSKISLALTEIAKTEQELQILVEDIAKLSVKIDVLNTSLEDVAQAFNNRIKESYKRSLIDPFYYFFSSKGLGDALTRIKYLQIVQHHDRDLMFQMQESKMNYDSQKTLKEEKQAEEEELKAQLVAQKAALAQQKSSKQELLQITKNDEQKFQSLLAAARAEYEAIQGILAGYGDETEVGPVSEGAKIASVIVGNSCNSSGTHLHFMVTIDGNPQNPFNYLKPIDHQNCSGGGVCTAADPFNPSGDWNWPLNPTITLNQGYGHTWAVQNTWVSQIYSFHNGIDIIGSSNDVKAVKSGTLYRGSYSVGCALRYVRLEHEGSNIETYYLHVNY